MIDPTLTLCLHIVCPPHVQEKLLDTLLAHAGNDVFTSTPTYSHGTTPGRLTAVEQVMGRSSAVHVQVLLSASALEALRDRLRTDFTGAGLRWWVSPILAEGGFA